jgi:CelD/BcsL family acetyltransferase involved in cellulose biosynthesis
MMTTRILPLNTPAWGTLLSRSLTGTFFQSTEWLSIWGKHFGGTSTVIGVFDNEQLIGIAPFLIRDEKVSILGIDPVLSGEMVSDFGDIISLQGREKEVWETIINKFQISNFKFQIKSKVQNLKYKLNFIREDSPSFQILKDLGGKIEETDSAPYLDLPKSWEEYLSGLDRHDRHELRRKTRKMEEAGVKQTFYTDNPQEIEEFFKLMVLGNEQKRNFLSPEMKEFFKSVIVTLSAQKLLELSFLKLENEYIAAVMLFHFKNEVLLYNSGFNPEYSYLSPGLILKSYTIKQAIESGRSRYDFLRGGERYKYDLGGRERKLYNIILG